MCTILGVLAAAMVTRLTAPTYRAEVDLFALAGDGTSGIQERGLFASERVKSYVQLVTSPAVITAVQQRLGRTDPIEQLSRSVRGESGTGTVILTVSADGPTPEDAQALASVTAQELARVVATMEGVGNPAVSPVALLAVAPPTLPSSPVSPRPLFNLFMGGVVGLAVGGAGFVALRQLDRTVHTADDLALAGGLRCLATVRRDRGAARLLEPAGAEPALLEDVRMLRARLELDGRDMPLAIAVVSAARREGRTAVVAALGRVVGQSGWRVTLVDADLRHPALHRLAGIGPCPGLAEAAQGRAPVDAVLHDAVEGMVVVPSGDAPAHSSELLRSPPFTTVHDELLKRSDVVVLDTPPLLDVADGMAVVAAADAVIVVVRSGVTPRADVQEVVAVLEDLGRRPLGAVLTMADRRRRRPLGLPTSRSPEGRTP